MNVQKIIVGLGVGKLVENWLTKEGCEVIAVSIIDAKMEDENIIKLANERDALIISMDKDFGELIF